ncbi:RodZ domain-containing protein [Aliivibrio salmonicida]|uniref:RodZ domain-containing protein n=1 Tax=Aliivibrio salmonicida TaxID=40269 RepID=UPI003D12B16B
MTIEHTEDNIETIIAPGQLLKNAREASNLTLEDISARLRLRVEVLEQIEADQFDMGKLATFTRGYYRSYAKAVNVPEMAVLNGLDILGKAQIEEHDMQSFSRKTKREKHDNRIMKLTWVIFALILSMSVLWWWQEQAQFETAEATSHVEEINKEEAVITDELADSSTESAVALDDGIDTLESSDTVVAPLAETTVTDEATDSIETPTVSEQAQEAIITDDVVITFNSDCWLQVKDAANNRLYSGVKKSNQTLKLTGKAPYELVIGAPNAVTLSYKGKPVNLSAYPAGKVARLTLPQ